MSVFFNGQLLTTPTVASAVDDSQMYNANEIRIPNTVAVIGTSLGGIPKEAMIFSSPMQAQKALFGGDLLRAVRKVFDPSADAGSPSRVVAMRVNAAVQSELAVKGEGSLSGSTVFTLTSTDYGAHCNNIKVTITKSSTDTTRRVVIQEGLDTVYARSGIGKGPMTVVYSGAEATATVAISTTAMTLAAPSGSTVATLTLANYNTVQELCDAINAVSGFTAVAVLPSAPVSGGALDEIATPASCKTTALTLRADLKAIIDWINTVAYGLVTAEIGSRYVPPGDVAGSYLSGGSNGPAVTNQDWQDAFDALQGSDVQWVVPLSDDSAIWAMASAHVSFMSSIGQERRAFVGGSVDDTADNAISYAKTLASDRVSFVWPGILDYDETGALVPYPGYYSAALVAGGFGSMNPGHAMTNKTLKVAGLSPLITSITDSDELINGNVLGLRQTKRGFIVTQSISTWGADNRFNRVEVSCGAAVDFVTRAVREALDRFIGAKGSPITLFEALSTTESVLMQMARQEPVGLGVIVGDITNPPYRGISGEITGDILKIWFECSPVIPINYVLVSVYVKPWGGTATLASGQ